MKNLKPVFLAGMALIGVAACDSEPEPAADNIIKTTVTVNGEKDTVINNLGKGHENADVSASCIKCLIGIVHTTENYKMLTTSIPPQNMIYYINWITAKNPIEVGRARKIDNGITIGVSLKDGGSPKKLTTFFYNNENAQFYLLNDRNKHYFNLGIARDSLKKIRKTCFWGIASGK
ncbi:MAG TPA: hypothetical protein VIM16_11930 [Mucilaginibacter sp.]|jgi:hypothetical protein